jgi:signal transduction histidine kinase
MIEFFQKLFDSDFMPHGHCYLMRPEIIWLHVISDALITVAYFSIPITLLYFIRKRRDVPFHWIFVMFGIFIFACGTTHLMEIWSVWHGTYRLSGVVKVVTAIASIGTAIMLVKLIPQALTLPTPEALQHSREQLRALTGRLQSLRENERIQLSREIHDELGQKLTGLKMDLLWVEKRLGELEVSSVINKLLDRVVGATEVVDEIIATVQEITAELRPGVLDKLGLGTAVQYEARRFEERTHIRCEARLPETDAALPAELSTALFRIFKECLTNVARHAHATKVDTELKVEDEWVILSVRDNGRGIMEAEIAGPGSLGLLGMTERAALLSGELIIQRAPGAGTIVTARIPKRQIPHHAKGTV